MICPGVCREALSRPGTTRPVPDPGTVPNPPINIFNSMKGQRPPMDEISVLNINVGSVEAEGLRVSDDAKRLALRCMRGEISFDEAVRRIIADA